MLVSNHLNSWGTLSKKTSSVLEVMAYLFCLVTLVIALFDNSISMDFFNISASMSFLSIILRGIPKTFSLRQWLLPVSILIVGITDLLWYSFFKSDASPFRSTYHNYLNTAKIFIFGCTLIFMAMTSDLRIKKEWPLNILYSLSFIVTAYAFYTMSTKNLSRLDFGIGTATGAAYSIMIIGLVSGIAILYTRRKHPLLFLINAAAIFSAVALTQTRSALLIFPVICVLTLVACYIKNPRKLFFSVIGFTICLLILVAVFSKPIYNRYHEGLANLAQYNSGVSDNNSLGSRLAMYEIGFDLFQESPLTVRSAEVRAQRMREMAKESPKLTGALDFADVHLHNELIEAASLKGLAGVLSTLLLYFSLIYTVYYYRSLGLLALTLAIIGLGLSDVILWSRSIPIILITSVTVMFFMKINWSIEPEVQR